MESNDLTCNKNKNIKKYAKRHHREKYYVLPILDICVFRKLWLFVCKFVCKPDILVHLYTYNYIL